MAEIFQYIVVFSLAVWTARLASTKGRNGWTWGAAALVLGLLPWHLIGVLPVLALMFIKNRADSRTEQPTLSSCARCHKSHSQGQHFCTGCGWDLHQADAPEKYDECQVSPLQPSISTTNHPTHVAKIPESADSSTTEPVFVAEQEPIKMAAEESETSDDTVPEDRQEEHVPWGTYAVGPSPTAAFMVSRGIERFNEGKFQEAIDQFTKAIALDPNYAEAWERRSESYTLLGRPHQAENDRQHLQGLDPSSSPS